MVLGMSEQPAVSGGSPSVVRAEPKKSMWQVSRDGRDPLVFEAEGVQLTANGPVAGLQFFSDGRVVAIVAAGEWVAASCSEASGVWSLAEEGGS